MAAVKLLFVVPVSYASYNGQKFRTGIPFEVNYLKKFTVLLVAIAAVISTLVSCATASTGKSELTIIGINSSIGGTDDNFSEQQYSYTITLQNNGATEVAVRFIEPVLLEPFVGKARGQDFKVAVDKTIAPEATLEIEGEIPFDARGMSKDQIIAMQPFFDEVKINTDRMLPVPGR
jgi:hypothetical protein